ncbi:MAG TPA: GatB/YqeY domain-containing protein [Candidatus Methylacidiphilales bacterium]
MSLTARIDEDLKKAMIARAAERLSVLRMLKSAVKYAAIESGGADAVPSDADVIAVLRKEVKKRQDSVVGFESGGRPELAAKEKAEIVILEEYLPTPLTPAELEEIVKASIAEVGATGKNQMGAVIKAAQAKAAGRVDGKTLSQLVQKLLP